MPALTFSLALLAFSIGIGVLWLNPRRVVNWAFGLLSLNTTLWLLFVFVASNVGARFPEDPSANPVPWLRGASAVGAFFPYIIWLLKEAIATGDEHLRTILRRSTSWLLVGLVLAALSFHPNFILPESQPGGVPMRGRPYFLYSASSFLIFLLLAVQTYRQTHKLAGIRRIEMQFLTLNAAIACLVVIALNAIGTLLGIRILSRFSPMVAIALFALTAWAVSFHRVFDAHQVFLNLTQRLGVITVLTFGVVSINRLLADTVATPIDSILAVAVCTPLILWLDRVSRDWLGLSPAQELAAMRRAITDHSRAQPNPDKLVTELEQLLREKSQTRFATLLFDGGDSYTGTSLTLSKNRTGHVALCREGWATPESLQRQRPVPGLVDLRQIMAEHELGLLVTSPPAALNPSLVLALGVKTNHRPFTYPEVQRLMDIAEFTDNTLARSRLTHQARQSEQLAAIGLLGASLAHEIRNPLVSIKTFAHLLPTRFHDEEFRRKFNQLIPTEVDRIDALTQQLLDLAHPKPHNLERVSLHAVVSDTMDLMQTNATEAEVAIQPRLAADPDTIRADGSAIRQVIINLLINSFQALETVAQPRRVEIRTRNHSLTGVVLEIADNGPGIPDDQRPRLFQPFASTKTKGMGLGLAVCADILRGHGATIIVPENNGSPGATFRITFPCPPPSS